MLLLHASQLSEDFYLWGEASNAGDAQGAPRSAFATLSELKSAVAGTPRETGGALAAETETVVWLPTSHDRPIASSSLLGGAEERPGTALLAPHVVDALRLTPTTAVAFLRSARGQAMLAPGVLLGHDVTFWSQLMRFAARLVAAQRYVPALVSARTGRKTRYVARWQARLGPLERTRLEALAAAMPGVCRALAHRGESAPTTSPHHVAQRFVERVVDDLVRTAARTRMTSGNGTVEDAGC